MDEGDEGRGECEEAIEEDYGAGIGPVGKGVRWARI